MRSGEVQKPLNASPGKLLAMRANGELKYIRIGGTIYYDHDDIEAMFEKFKVNNKGKNDGKYNR